MAYSSTMNWNAATAVLSGVLTSTAGEPIGGVIVSGYADASIATMGTPQPGSAAAPAANVIPPGSAFVAALAAFFAQTRSDSSGNWSLSVASLQPGAHSVGVNVDYGLAAVGSASIVTTAPAAPVPASRQSIVTNNNPRA